MAFNQASFFLFAPGFGPVVEQDHTAKTASGKPLELVSTTLTDSTAPKVFTEDLRRWFSDRGFMEKERYGVCQVMYRGRQTTSLGTQEVIVLTLRLEEDVLKELYIRFLLTEQTPKQILEWKDLVAELGHDFGFQIMGENRELLPCVDFLVILTQNLNFCTFQKNYGWEI